MEQFLLLVSVVVALFVIFTKPGQKVVQGVSKSVSSLTKNSKREFPVILVILVVLVVLICLSHKQLMEGLMVNIDISETNIDQICNSIKSASDSSGDAPDIENTNQPYDNCNFTPSLNKNECAMPLKDLWPFLRDAHKDNWPEGCPTTPPSTMGMLNPCKDENTNQPYDNCNFTPSLNKNECSMPLKDLWSFLRDAHKDNWPEGCPTTPPSTMGMLNPCK